MKKLLVTMTVIFALTGCAGNSTADPLPTKSTSASSEEIEVSSIDKLVISSYSLPEHKTYDHIDAVKLTLKDGANDVTVKIANTVNEWIASEIADFQATAKDEYKKHRKNASVLEFNMTFDESAVSDRIYALTFTDYRFEGGAHGSSVVKTFAFDLNDGSQFDLVSQINPDKRFEFDVLVAATLGEQAGTFDVDLDSQQTIITTLGNDENYTAWFASKTDGLAIIFQQYAVGPYSSGQPTISLTWKQLKPLLNSDSILLSEFAE
jgi:hypothetical protein